MPTDIAQAYDHCQRIARERAKNFYYAFRTLPRDKRRALYAVYAYCRLCDDIADDDMPIESKRRMFADTRALLERALAAAAEAHPARASTAALPPEFAALSHAVARYHISTIHFFDVLDGVESDLVKTRYANFGELREYCRKVASAVGLICIEVFGFQDPRAPRYATDMGIALQLTNILRDIKEDAARDRIYIPQDEMAECGVGERELKDGVMSDGFRALMRRQTARARAHYERSRPLFEMVEPESRTCLRSLHAAYSAILNRIERSGFDVYSRRIGLSAAEKLFIIARLWADGALRAAAPRSLRRGKR